MSLNHTASSSGQWSQAGGDISLSSANGNPSFYDQQLAEPSFSFQTQFSAACQFQSLPVDICSDGRNVPVASNQLFSFSQPSEASGYNAENLLMPSSQYAPTAGNMGWYGETSVQQPLSQPASVVSPSVAPIPAFVSSALFDDGLYFL